MPQSSSKIEPLSTTPDEKISSVNQIDRRALNRALIRKPSFKVLKTLLAHRRSLQCLIAKLDLKVEKSDAAKERARHNYGRTMSALRRACHSTKSPYPKTRPRIIGDALTAILHLQSLYMAISSGYSRDCREDRRFTKGCLQEVEKRLKKVARVLARSSRVSVIVDHEEKGEAVAHGECQAGVP